MEHALSELPLALFTTLASLGAGAFIALAAAVWTTDYEEKVLSRIDKMAAIPLGVVLVSFVCAFFHLASPFHAFGVFAGIGSSPLSNELVAGCLFFVAAAVYWIAGVAGKLSSGARRVLLTLCAVLALFFAVFMGLAYMMDTIAGWNTALVPLQMVGFALLDAATFGNATLYAAAALKDTCGRTYGIVSIILAIAGLVLGCGSLACQMFAVAGMSNALISGANLVGGTVGYFAFGMVLVAGSVGCSIAATLGRSPKLLVWASVGLSALGVLSLRLVFYALELSVGPVM